MSPTRSFLREVTTGVRFAFAFALALFAVVAAFPHVADAAAPAVTTVKVADTPRTETPRLTPESHRLTDEDFARDLATIAEWQRTLDSLGTMDPRPSAYHLASAQGLLNLARQQYERGDRCGAVPAAFQEGTRLIQRMRAHERGMALEPPAILRTSGVPSELWDLAMELHGHPGFGCIEAQVAKYEFLLLDAAHEARERQPCDSTRLGDIARLLYDEARATAEACVVRNVSLLPSPELPRPGPHLPERRAELLREIELLPKLVHFALDSSSINSSTAAVLDGIAAKLAKYPEIRVRLSGHTDKRASVAYNLRLSKRRAESVKAYLLNAGVGADRFDVEYFGKSLPRVVGESIGAFARNRCVIFEYMLVGELSVDIVPIEQENDLQIEKAGQKKKHPLPDDR